MNATIAIAAAYGLLLTIAGALGAHAIPVDSADLRSTWDSALLFGFVHVLAAVLASQVANTRPLARFAGWAFLLGATFFSLLLVIATAAKSGALPAALQGAGSLAPVGGVSFMIGWLVLIVAALRSDA